MCVCVKEREGGIQQFCATEREAFDEATLLLGDGGVGENMGNQFSADLSPSG